MKVGKADGKGETKAEERKELPDKASAYNTVSGMGRKDFHLSRGIFH